MVLITGVALAAMALPSQASAQQRQFNLPAQPASKAIAEFARQAGVQISAPGKRLRGVRTQSVQGTHDVRAALRQMLEGTGLDIVADSGGVITLAPRSTPERPRLQRTSLQTASAPVTAAATPPETAPEAPAEPIVVTGSRLGRTDVPTPVQAVSEAQLRAAGRQNVVAALNDLPQFKPSTLPQAQGTAVFAGTWSVDLRGLGSNRTLNLFDGRRLIGDYVRTDLSVIPSILIDRADVVTGSASAAWGSNAVGGVVNLITKRKLEGFRVNAEAGISSRADAEHKRIEGAFGTSFADGRGNVLIGAEYSHSDGFGPKTSRKNVGRWALVSNPNAGSGEDPLIYLPDVGDARLSPGGIVLTGVNTGLAFNPDGSLSPFNRGLLIGNNAVGGDSPSIDDVVVIAPPIKRYSAMARVSYDVTDDIRLTADVIHAKIYGRYPYVPDANYGDITINAENPFLSQAVRNQLLAAGEATFRMGRFNTDFAMMEIDYSRRTTQATIALEGKLGGSWNWSGHYSHGAFYQPVYVYNDRIRSNFANAVDVVADPVSGQPICRIALTVPTTDCVPINLFGFGAPSSAAADYVTGTSYFRLKQKLDTGGLTVRGEPFTLPAGEVSVAFGVEARKERAKQENDPISKVNGFSLFNRVAYQGSNVTKEAFGEIYVPLVHNVPGLQKLSLNAAARITHDRTGSIWSWKLGATNRVVDGVDLRATVSRDIRAPNLTELYSPQTSGLITIVDPAKGNASYGPVTSLSGGNPNLEPEASRTFTAGITVAPGLIPGLRLSADYFNIKIKNAISTIAPQLIVNLCEVQDTPAACDAITRDSDGFITTIAASQLNFLAIRTSGIDFGLDFSVPVSAGTTLRSRSNFTWVHEFETDNGFAKVDFRKTQANFTVQGVPKLTGITSLALETDRFQAMIRGRYLSAGYHDGTTLVAIENNRIPAYLYVDAGASFTVRQDDRREFQLFGNVNNLFDKAPPVFSQFSTYYDTTGRAFVAGVRMKF
jgi:outer membrane receptor protein involved in Fe transport